MSVKLYTGIGLVVAAVLYLLSLFAASPLLSFVTTMQSQAQYAGLPPVITRLIVEPFRLGLTTGVIGPAVLGLLWPLLAVWFFLLVLMIVFAVVGAGAVTTRTEIFGS